MRDHKVQLKIGDDFLFFYNSHFFMEIQRVRNYFEIDQIDITKRINRQKISRFPALFLPNKSPYSRSCTLWSHHEEKQ